MVLLTKFPSKLCTFMYISEHIDSFHYIEELTIYINNFLINASNQIENHKTLAEVLVRAKEKGLKFNKTNSKFFKRLIKFAVHIFNENSAKPDKEKIKSKLQILTPINVKIL